jgi:hypothetical protein
MSATAQDTPQDEGMDPHALATLSPEEREALAIELDDEDEPQGGEDDADEDADGADEQAGADAEAADEKPADTPAADAAPEPEPAPALATAKQPDAPAFKADLPEDFEAQVKTLRDDAAALRKRLADGEIDVAEFSEQQEAIFDRRANLDALRVKAEVAAELSKQTGEQSARTQWVNTVNAFVAATAAAGDIDYGKDADKAQQLDAFVRALGNDPRHNDKPMDWFMKEAHRMVRAYAGLPPVHDGAKPPSGDAPPAGDKAKAAVKAAVAKRKPPLADAPKNIAHVAGGPGPGDVGDPGEFAHLDRLSGEKLEDAMGRMTPAQRERYLAA